MKFNYFKFPLAIRSDFFGTNIFKPIIPIELTFSNHAIRYAALIDSGADFCIFDAEIGEELGIDIHSGSREVFGGVQEAGAGAPAGGPLLEFRFRTGLAYASGDTVIRRPLAALGTLAALS